MTAMDRLQIDLSDFVTFHSYDSPTEFEKRINWLKRYNRPMICTEYMARGNGSFFFGTLGRESSQRGHDQLGLRAGQNTNSSSMGFVAAPVRRSRTVRLVPRGLS